MPRKSIAEITFAKVYPMYVHKAERKGRTKAEVDALIHWLTGYDDAGIADQIARETNFATFFAEAPDYTGDADKITGVICGYRVEEIEEEVERKVRQLDKIIDELAKGRKMEKIRRA